jgi:hypothetical protein
MENNMKLYMVMLGCTRLDDIPNNMIFFLELVLKENSPWNERLWPEAKGRIHIDAWREVAVVDNFRLKL